MHTRSVVMNIGNRTLLDDCKYTTCKYLLMLPSALEHYCTFNCKLHFAGDTGRTELACWSHARRYLFNAQETDIPQSATEERDR